MKRSILCLLAAALLLGLPAGACAAGARFSDDASDFLSLSEAVPDAILEIRYYSTYNFVGERIDGYEEPLALLTREAAAALKAVSDELIGMGYIAKRSGHSRGSTVDLTLFDMAAGKEVDMGGTFDYFGRLSHPDFGGVTEAQHANRMLLRDVMLRHGFKPLSTEWWHFTLIDEPFPNTYFTFPVSSNSLIPALDGAA